MKAYLYGLGTHKNNSLARSTESMLGSSQWAMMTPQQKSNMLKSGAVGGGAGIYGGGGGSGSGYGGLGIAGAAWDAANAANEQRYKDILGGYKGLRARNRSRIGKLGKQERRDISERFKSELSSQQARMRRRGLGGTSLASSAAMSSRRRESDAQGGLNERLLRQQIMQDSADTERIGGVMERRTDTAPDMDFLARMGQMQGSGGGGMAGAPIFAGGGYGGFGFGGNMHIPRVGGYQRQRTQMRPRNLNSLRYTGNTRSNMGAAYYGGRPRIAASQPFLQGQIGSASMLA